MAKRLARIKKDRPELAERTDIQDVAADIDIYATLAGFASSDTGSLLLEAQRKEIASTVRAIVAGYKTLPEIELRALAAKLEARLNLVQSLTRAKTNLDDAEQMLKELLQ